MDNELKYSSNQFNNASYIMNTVQIKSGSYRNAPVSGTFTLVKGYQLGAKGGFVTVRNDGKFPGRPSEIRVSVDNPDEVVTGAAKVKVVTETDEQAMDRIASRFAILDEMSRACINGDIRSLIVSGPPGVGKSHGVTTQMEKATLFDAIADKPLTYTIVKGAMSGIGLFATLYKYSGTKNVIVLDDCDIWQDQDALNILKGALDSGKSRRISWNKDSRILRDEGIPNQFNFNGSVIFITNMQLDGKKASAIKPHMEALQSRSHYLDLTIDTERDKMLRIRQVHRDAHGGLFVDYAFTDEQEAEVLDFMWENQAKLRETSIRCALKIADLVKISPKNWRGLAAATICK